MGASELIGRLVLAGVELSANRDQLVADIRPRAALTEELRELIRGHKAELLAALASASSGVERRRNRALAELEANPGRKRVAIFDVDSEPSFAICTLAIRHIGTCDLRIPRDRFDAWAVLEALQRIH